MRWLRHAEEAVSVALGVLLFGVLIWQVFTRYVLDDPSLYTEEAARYLYVGVVFFGAAAAVTSRTHIGMPFVVEKLPAGARLAVALFTQLLTLGFCAGIALYGWRAALREWDLPTMAMEIPTGLVLGVVPVAMALIGLRTAVNMVRDVADYRRGEFRATAAAGDF